MFRRWRNVSSSHTCPASCVRVPSPSQPGFGMRKIIINKMNRVSVRARATGARASNDDSRSWIRFFEFDNNQRNSNSIEKNSCEFRCGILIFLFLHLSSLHYPFQMPVASCVVCTMTMAKDRAVAVTYSTSTWIWFSFIKINTRSFVAFSLRKGLEIRGEKIPSSRRPPYKYQLQNGGRQ